MQERTDNLNLLAELERRVRTDALTQLASKAQMLEWLETVEDGSAFVLLDLDDFRLLNQTLGHDAGDILLTLVARRLEAACPAPHFRVGRISQDEFAVLRVGLDAAPERLESMLADVFRDSFRIGDRVVGVRATCGISTCGSGKSPMAVVREADTAMYEAKASAKGGALFFDEVFRQRAVEAFEISEGLRHALSNHQLKIHYQPEVDLGSGRVIGAEALLRWSHPVLGSIPPTSFIPVAEACGMIGEIGAFVLDGALAQRRFWVDRGLIADDFTMAVNISARQLEDPQFVDAVAWALESNGCPPRCLCIELTESALMAEPVEAVARLDRMAELGIRLAIDDFGTGYSSFSYLQYLPITDLKIDRSFVSRSSEPRGAALVEAILGIARALDLGTIAEGIETLDQRDLVRRLGCRTGQGYVFSRPAAADRFIEAVIEAQRHAFGRPLGVGVGR